MEIKVMTDADVPSGLVTAAPKVSRAGLTTGTFRPLLKPFSTLSVCPEITFVMNNALKEQCFSENLLTPYEYINSEALKTFYYGPPKAFYVDCPDEITLIAKTLLELNFIPVAMLVEVDRGVISFRVQQHPDAFFRSAVKTMGVGVLG